MAEKKTHSLAELEDLYTQADQVDSDIFPEMRSNLLLVAGEHYSKRQANIFRKLRDSKDLSDSQKIRLTNNHIQRITKGYANNILSTAPGVGFSPKNESELQDQKAAELHKSVWIDAQKKYNLDEWLDDSCDDFVQIGEVHTKIFWDAQGGKLLGHRQLMTEDGELQFDEDGLPALGEPVYEGEFIWEQIYGFNLLRAPEAKILSKSPYLITRKMVDIKDLQAKWPEEKSKIQASADSTVTVFDGGKAGYRKAQNEVMLKEIYFRPCADYPRGCYYFWTKEVVLHTDELPGGIFPIVSEPFEKIQTTPRGRSIIKVARPYQVEINRAASKMAEHQITLGDDKLIISSGSEVSAGAALPGVRTIYTNGADPKVMPGRDGSQYLNYMQSKIEEMYRVVNMAEDAQEKQSGQMDPYALLFRSSKQKKQFQRYVNRFSRYLKNVAKTYLSLAKTHLPEDAFIQAAGKNELVNIAEFKNSNDLGYEVVLDDQSEDIESKMGKQLVLNHMIQFAGSQLKPEDLGKLMRLSPYANFDDSFSDLTMDYDSATNIILALDRGERPTGSMYDNLQYMVKRLVARVRQADFKQLQPQVQQNYKLMIGQYEKAIQQQTEQLQAMKDGFIPTDGYLVTLDFYVPDPANPERTKRARLPYGSIMWLIKKLETQGTGLQQLEQMNSGALQQIASQMSQRPRETMAPPPGMQQRQPMPA